ncbi:hypothetical protein [Blastococcus colisei]|uniref:hypothetical protein n=1 Tax=Blastococcus colisei TaxID=1564162 RepID=UPI001150335A|nr:hypothetical protein [Blastococcus colisei]
MTSRWDRITAAAGLLFVALVVASFFTPSIPEYGSTADELAAGITDERAGHQMSLLLGFLADIAFLVFLAGVWSRFRRHEGSGGMMSGLFAIAGAAFVATILIAEGIYLALVQAAESADPSTLPTIAALDYWVGLCTVPVAVAMMIGATGAILSTHALPTWLGYLSGVNAVVLVLGLGGVFESSEETWFVAIGGFGGFLLFLIWTLATSIVLLMRSRHRTEATA